MLSIHVGVLSSAEHTSSASHLREWLHPCSNVHSFKQALWSQWCQSSHPPVSFERSRVLAKEGLFSHCTFFQELELARFFGVFQERDCAERRVFAPSEMVHWNIFSHGMRNEITASERRSR